MNYLVDVINLRALFGPIAMTQREGVLGETGEHDDDDAALLPDHLPEVGGCAGQGALGRDVGRVPGVVVRLRGNRGTRTGSTTYLKVPVPVPIRVLRVFEVGKKKS